MGTAEQRELAERLSKALATQANEAREAGLDELAFLIDMAHREAHDRATRL